MNVLKVQQAKYFQSLIACSFSFVTDNKYGLVVGFKFHDHAIHAVMKQYEKEDCNFNFRFWYNQSFTNSRITTN